MHRIQHLFVLVRAGHGQNTGVVFADVIRVGPKAAGDDHPAILGQLPPTWIIGNSANISGLGAETAYMAAVVDDANCAVMSQLIIEKPKPVEAWGFNGNPGAGKWLGTGDSTDLSFRTNGAERLLIKAGGDYIFTAVDRQL
jgi:hypothetical protein